MRTPVRRQIQAAFMYFVGRSRVRARHDRGIGDRFRVTVRTATSDTEAVAEAESDVVVPAVVAKGARQARQGPHQP